MATQDIMRMGDLIRTTHGQSPFTLDLPEEASMSTLRGGVVVFDGGYVGDAGADPSLILGIQAEDGNNLSSDGDGNISVYIAHPGSMFIGTLCQAAANTVAAATDIGTAYGIIIRSSAPLYWVIDSTDTSAVRCTPMERKNDHAATDTNAAFYFMFYTANCVMIS